VYTAGSGAVTDVGVGKGKFYAVNVPLSDGIDDQMYFSIFNRFTVLLSLCVNVLVLCSTSILM